MSPAGTETLRRDMAPLSWPPGELHAPQKGLQNAFMAILVGKVSVENQLDIAVERKATVPQLHGQIGADGRGKTMQNLRDEPHPVHLPLHSTLQHRPDVVPRRPKR